MDRAEFEGKISKAASRMDSLEDALGLGLDQQSCITNSGPRKTLAATQRQQIMPLRDPELQLVGTAFEEKFGDRSSSISIADQDYDVVGRVCKFSHIPQHHYWLLLVNHDTKTIRVKERKIYVPRSESYGFLNDNSTLDGLEPGVSKVHKGDILQRSTAYNNEMCRCDGINLNTIYLCLDQNMEDSVIISEPAADKLRSQLIKPVPILINKNTIPLNLYGSNGVYKSFPDVGEKSRDDGFLIGLRTQVNENNLFMESNERLQSVMTTDDTRKVKGTVIDIDVLCNDPEHLMTDVYCEQFQYYYKEQQRVNQELLTIVTPYLSQGYKADYQLQKMIGRAKLELNHVQHIEGGNNITSPFEYMKVNITVLEDLPMKPGDKMTNGYGAKGVVSKVLPEEEMPVTETGVRAEVIMNGGGMCGRENVAQCSEIEYTYIGRKIVQYIKEHEEMSLDDAYNMILKYYWHVSESMYNYVVDKMKYGDDEDKAFMVDSILNNGEIAVRALPATEAFTIFKLQAMYNAFPFIDLEDVYVPIPDSNGNIRLVKARRKMMIAKEYFWRLKQFAEEKFSAVSLASTNIRNQNTKTRASKNYREVHSDTPIRAGYMEIDQMSSHMGPELVIANLMLHSTSPHGRRLVEAFYIDDPYNTDIVLDQDATNRNAEVVITYLKAMGLRLVHVKHKRVLVPILEDNIFDPFGPLGEYREPDMFHIIDGSDAVANVRKMEQTLAEHPLLENIRFY